MANTIKIKQSATQNHAPTALHLAQGELAINTTDEKLYTKNSSGAVVQLNAQPDISGLVSATNDGTAVSNIAFALSGTVLTITTS